MSDTTALSAEQKQQAEQIMDFLRHDSDGQLAMEELGGLKGLLSHLSEQRTDALIQRVVRNAVRDGEGEAMLTMGDSESLVAALEPRLRDLNDTLAAQATKRVESEHFRNLARSPKGSGRTAV